MKVRFAALLLAAVIVLSGSASALFLPASYDVGTLSGLCEDGDGFLAADTYNHVVWRFEGNTVTRIAGQTGVTGGDGKPIGDYVDGSAQCALFMEPWAIAPFLDGYAITDAGANVVRYYDGESVRTIAGSGKAGNRDGSGTAVKFHRPTGLAAGPDGALFVADTGNGSIRIISKDGKVKTLYRNLNEPTGISYADGALYVAETGGNRVTMISDGISSTIAGGDLPGYVDGPVERSRLRAPQGVAIGGDGSVYIADTGNGAVRCVQNGRITTMRANDGSPEPPAQPRGIIVQGNTLLVTDAVVPAILDIDTLEPTFSDVEDDSVFCPYIAAAAKRGLTSGTGNGAFSPDLPVSRAQFVVMLSRMHHSVDGDQIINGDAVFTDVEDSAWYAPAVLWAADQQLVQGSDGAFFPNNSITCQDMVTILYRYAQQNGHMTTFSGDLSRFRDVAEISGYAREAMTWAVGTGIVSGDTSGDLAPRNTVTRAQAVQILVCFMDAAGI